ncbi:MAG: hypothetical protein AAF193_04965, partial [Bacteroidota bacterium]
LLTELEKDPLGIKKLRKHAECSVVICRHQYVFGNAGICISPNIINRLNHLGLGLDIDTYIVGGPLD